MNLFEHPERLGKNHEKLISLGEKLLKRCPYDDCLLYRNVFSMWKDIKNDLESYALSDTSRDCLKHQLLKQKLQLMDLYHFNHAIKRYRREEDK